MVDRTVEEPPPFTVLVHGPPGVGKTTLIKGLIKHYTRQDVREVKGPITLIAGKARRCRRGRGAGGQGGDTHWKQTAGGRGCAAPLGLAAAEHDMAPGAA